MEEMEMEETHETESDKEATPGRSPVPDIFLVIFDQQLDMTSVQCVLGRSPVLDIYLVILCQHREDGPVVSTPVVN